MNNQLLEEITSEYIQDKRDHFKVGDGVKVHVKVGKVRRNVSKFLEVLLFAAKDLVVHETFTVRRIASGVGVERVFPFILL